MACSRAGDHDTTAVKRACHAVSMSSCLASLVASLPPLVAAGGCRSRGKFRSLSCLFVATGVQKTLMLFVPLSNLCLFLTDRASAPNTRSYWLRRRSPQVRTEGLTGRQKIRDRRRDLPHSGRHCRAGRQRSIGSEPRSPGGRETAAINDAMIGKGEREFGEQARLFLGSLRDAWDSFFSPAGCPPFADFPVFGQHGEFEGVMVVMGFFGPTGSILGYSALPTSYMEAIGWASRAWQVR